MKRRLAKAQVKRAHENAARWVDAAERRAQDQINHNALKFSEWVGSAREELKALHAEAFVDAMREVTHLIGPGGKARVRIPDLVGFPMHEPAALAPSVPAGVVVELDPLQVLAVWHLLAKRLDIPAPQAEWSDSQTVRVIPHRPHRLLTHELVLKVR